MVATGKRRNQLASEPNYHTTKYFSESLIPIEIKKTKVKMNKPEYVGLLILDISKTLMYAFWFIYIKPKYQDRAKLCYMVTDSFVIHVKTEDFYEEIANDVEKWFDTSNYSKDDNRPLLIGWNKIEIGFLKVNYIERLWKNLLDLREKTWEYLLDDDSKHKKAKGTKQSIIKRELMFKNYKDCQSNDKTILKSQHRFKSNCHNVFTEQIKKIALSTNDDKRLRTFDKITTYPYGTNVFKVCKSEMISKI